MNPVVSIVVPVYKVEKYLHQCVDSILNQSFSNFELILVDDGSPDNCPKICDAYASKDTRVKVYHLFNGGVSKARNYGVSVSSAEWITFVDSDDYLAPTYLSSLLAPALNSPEIQFVHCGLTNDWGGEYSIEQQYDDSIDNDPLTLFLQIRGLVPSKLFKSEIIRSFKVRFDEQMKIAEDYAFTLDYILHVRDYAFVSEVGYFYRRHHGSTTMTCNRSYEISKQEFYHQYDSTLKYIHTFQLSEDRCDKRLKLLSNYLLQTILLLIKSEFKGNVNQQINKDFSPRQIALLKLITRKTDRVKIYMISHNLSYILKLSYRLQYYLRLCLKKK